MRNDDTSIWVHTDPNDDGTYVATLELAPGLSVALDHDVAHAHAAHVLAAAQRAEYDAAIMGQLVHALTVKGEPKEQALQYAAKSLDDIRQTRPELPASPTPIRLLPGVSVFTGQPFLVLFVREEEVGQWSVSDARQHALFVLETVDAAELDNGYFKAIQDIFDVAPHVAENMISDLDRFRQEFQ